MIRTNFEENGYGKSLSFFFNSIINSKKQNNFLNHILQPIVKSCGIKTELIMILFFGI